MVGIIFAVDFCHPLIVTLPDSVEADRGEVVALVFAHETFWTGVPLKYDFEHPDSLGAHLPSHNYLSVLLIWDEFP